MSYSADCNKCKLEVRPNHAAVACIRCKDEYHIACLSLSAKHGAKTLAHNNIFFICDTCKVVVLMFLSEENPARNTVSDTVVDSANISNASIDTFDQTSVSHEDSPQSVNILDRNTKRESDQSGANIFSPLSCANSQINVTSDSENTSDDESEPIILPLFYDVDLNTGPFRNSSVPHANFSIPPPNLSVPPPNFSRPPPNFSRPPPNFSRHPPNLSRPPSSATKKVLLLGDSMVREQSIYLRDKNCKNITVSSNSGARIAEINNMLTSDKLRNSDDIIFAAVGTNNIGRDSGVSIQKNYEDLIINLKKRKTKSAICGIIPRVRASANWNIYASNWNKWLRVRCLDAGIHFIDTWEQFYNKPHLFSLDGVHLSPQGKHIFAQRIINVTKNVFFPFLSSTVA